MVSPAQQILVPSKKEKLALLRTLLKEQDAEFYEQDQQSKIPLLSTSISALLDGLPKDEIVQISGPQSSGKTTLALQMVTEISRNGMYCAIIDETARLFPPALEELGADVQRVLFVTPPPPQKSSKQNLLLWSIEQSIDSGIFSLILVLSQRELPPKIQWRLQRSCARAQTALLLTTQPQGARPGTRPRIHLEIQPSLSAPEEGQAHKIAAPVRQLRCTLHLRNRPMNTMVTCLSIPRSGQNQ